MKFGLSIVSRSFLSSFLSFQTWHLVMHSKGVIGAQFLHSASRVVSISARSFFLSPFFIGVRTFPIGFPPGYGGVVTGEGVRDWV